MTLTCAEIDLRHEIIELDRKKTAPTGDSYCLGNLTSDHAELQVERRRLPNVEDPVFTIDGKQISKNFFDSWFR